MKPIETVIKQTDMKNLGLVRCNLGFLLILILILILLPAVSWAEDTTPRRNAAAQTAAVSYSNLYVKVQLDGKLKPAALKAGDVVPGTLSRSVFWRDQELFPAGSSVRLIVDKLERRKRAPNDHWPWVIKAFTPRHEKYPTFQSAQVLLADGSEVSLRVSLVSIGQEIEVQAAPRKGRVGQHPEKSATADNFSVPPSTSPRKYGKKPKPLAASPTANFEAVVVKAEELPPGPHSPSASSGETVTVAAGTHAKVILLDSVSASKSRPGDSFKARLVEPVYAGHTLVLPEGTVFEGKVTKRVGPRTLSRSGSLLLSFIAVTSPSGTIEPIAASIAGIQLNPRSHTRVDPEGQLKGDRPGKAWMLMNLGVTGGISKEVDDGTQLLIEAIVSSATDVSTAGTARIAGACASGLFMLTRHGRDVVLPKFTEMDIMFDRPVSLFGIQPMPTESSMMDQ